MAVPKVVRPVGFGIVVGAVIAATAFLAGARIPGAGGGEILPATHPAAEPGSRRPDRATERPAVDSAAENRIAELLRLADSDADAALARLARIDDARLRRDAALSLLEALGDDLAGIDRIAAALTPAERLNFTFDALAQWAARDSSAAIAAALALDTPAAQNEAIARIGTALAAADARLALDSAAAIASYRLADTFRAAVLEEWAAIDPDGFLSFLENAGPRDIPRRNDAFRIAAASVPDRLLALLDRVPENQRSAAELAGVEALVRTDPAGAFAHIDAMPGSAARNRLLTGAARSFALHDLEAALAWLEARASAGPTEISAVLDALAETDPVRAVDMLIANARKLGNASAFGGAIDALTRATPAQLAIVADRLSAAEDAPIRFAFRRLMESWSMSDAEAAFGWAFDHIDRLSAEAAQALAGNLASANAELAKQAAARLPLERQGPWIRTVAMQLARDDIDDTLQWLARYQGQPFYEDTVELALLGLAAYEGGGDPRSIAAFLERQSPQLRASSGPEVGYYWASTDPQAAAEWAERLDLGSADESRRAAIFSNVAGQWAARDPDAARDWVLVLPQGTMRDQVLSSFLGVTARSGRIDSSVIAAFSSDEQRRASLLVRMPALGRSNPVLGRTLIDRYFDDPRERAQAEQRLIEGASDRSGADTGGTVIFN